MSETNELESPPWGIFPPWGVMNAEDVAVALKTPRRPLSWLGDEASYVKWFDTTLATIQELIWPVFDSASQSWIGPAAQSMKMLTEADMELFRLIRTGKPLIFESSVAPNTEKTYHNLFNDEDESVKTWMQDHKVYDPQCTDAELAGFRQITRLAYFTNVGGSVLNFKYLLQRPRPWQMAMILKGNSDFDHYEALTADTPSAAHGHCAQGLLIVGAVMEYIILGNVEFGEDRWAALEQIAVDIGDRRVMARVHYPSDSICSWLIVMSMANHIFRSPLVKERIWNAITQRSYVYRLITQATEHAKTYGPALEALGAAAKS